MSEKQQFASERLMGRRYEYDGRTVLAADFGSVGDASVDVVDGTVIVVADDEQYEFDLPEGPATASMNNGVLTVEIGHEDEEVSA